MSGCCTLAVKLNKDMNLSLKNRSGWILTLLFCFSSLVPANAQKRYTVMGIGDSITEGSPDFSAYLYPLWRMLFSSGYDVEFIGPRTCKCRVTHIKCSATGGTTVEYAESKIDSIYRAYPADIILLHGGHNHFAEEKPIPGIIAAQESIISKIRAINPKVRILVAQVITSGKLPKYSYIPELNREIAKMVKRQHSENVILVNQAKGFDWRKYTVKDKVHPNQAGAEKMAGVWFKTLKKIMIPSTPAFKPEIVSYKTSDTCDLKLHIFKPAGIRKGEKRPVIVFFFGGGWSYGTPLQFYRECTYYASKGIVAIAADYRINFLNKTTAFESVADARDAIRWIRMHALHLNADTARIAAAGASAGGHLAAVTGIIDEKPVGKVSSKADLLLLYYAVVDNSNRGYGSDAIKERYQEISPIHNINPQSPATLFILGTKDPIVSVQTARDFVAKLRDNGVYGELHLVEGAGHPIFSYTQPLTDVFYRIRELTDAFLDKNGYFTGF